MNFQLVVLLFTLPSVCFAFDASTDGSGHEHGSGEGVMIGNQADMRSENVKEDPHKVPKEKPTSTTTAATTTTTTTTTTAATTTTTKSCTWLSKCSSDAECGSGKCAGVFAGKCDCNACMNYVLCQDDTGCGGLRGACHPILKTCDCNEGFRKNGFATYIDALRDLCNAKQCTQANDSDSCFGLRCNSGTCLC